MCGSTLPRLGRSLLAYVLTSGGRILSELTLTVSRAREILCRAAANRPPDAVMTFLENALPEPARC